MLDFIIFVAAIVVALTVWTVLMVRIVFSKPAMRYFTTKTWEMTSVAMEAMNNKEDENENDISEEES